MKATRMILAIGAVCSALVLVGCTHTVEVVVNNSSAKSLPVKVRGLGLGEKVLGNASAMFTFKGKVDIPNKALPIDLIVKVGKQSLTFPQVTKGTRQVIMYVSLEDGKLKKGSKDKITEEKKIDTKTPIGEPESVIE